MMSVMFFFIILISSRLWANIYEWYELHRICNIILWHTYGKQTHSLRFSLGCIWYFVDYNLLYNLSIISTTAKLNYAFVGLCESCKMKIEIQIIWIWKFNPAWLQSHFNHSATGSLLKILIERIYVAMIFE